MNAAKNNKGFTIIEMLIAMVVSSLLMGGIYTIFTSQMRVSTTQEQIAAVQQNIRSAMYVMEKEIRMAGYGGTLTGGTATGFTTATATNMSFDYLTNSSDPTQTQFTITYALVNNNLTRTVDDPATGQTQSIVAENIEAVEFCYTYTDDAGSGTEKSTTPNAPAEVNTIQSIEVSILARSSKAIPGSQTGRVFSTPGLDTWGDDEDYNDGRFRRYTSSNIICRNL